MDTLYAILETEAVAAAILSLAGAFVAWLLRREKVKEWRLEQAVLFLQGGVDASYRDYVRAVKQASADGKLTDQERTTARQIALETAIAHAREHGLDLVREYGSALLSGLLEQILRRNKAEAAEGQRLGPLAELSPELEVRSASDS